MNKQYADTLTIADFDFKREKFDFLCIATSVKIDELVLIKDNLFL